MYREHVEGESIRVHNSHEERINTVLIMKNIKYNMKCSQQRNGTCGSLAVAHLEMAFRTIIPYG